MIDEQDVRDWEEYKERDWEEYYRNVNAFNIPNADAKRVEIWDKSFLSTETVRETLWEVYSKGFMDGVNDTSERFKSSAYKQEHDADLLDKVAERINYESYCKDAERPCSSSDCLHCEYGYIDSEKILKVIEELKAEIEK